MERGHIVTREVEGEVFKYYFDIEYNQGSFLLYPYVRGYYLIACPCETIKYDDNDTDKIVKNDKYEARELLFEISEPNERAFVVAKEVADCYIDSLIVQIEQNKLDALREEQKTRKEIREKIKKAEKDGDKDEEVKSNEDVNKYNIRRSGSMNKDEDCVFDVVKSEVTLDDIAGLDEVKEELLETVSGFKDKSKFEKFGIKPINGILLHGLPGNGKSMLSRAIAGSCGVNYIETAGSEFMEKWVGMGSKRVRELFKLARDNKPCIIFIDEIDGVASKRSDENSKEQNATLNQLLVEISSLDNDDLLIIGATNREDILDPAIKRQGRLTKNIYVPNPDMITRHKILSLYSKDKPLARDVDLEKIASQTSGMSGADMEGIIRQACLLAIREDADEVNQDMLVKAIDRQIAGLENKSTVLEENEKRIACIHESGHLLVGKMLNSRKPSKITIVPHGQALGYVLYHEENDKFINTRKDLMDRIKVSLGGLASEKVFFGHESTGCSSDLGNVTSIAMNMVQNYGMSNLGKMKIDDKNIFLQEKVHEEMKKIVDVAYREVLEMITDNKDKITLISDELFEKETLTENEIDELFEKM